MGVHDRDRIACRQHLTKTLDYSFFIASKQWQVDVRNEVQIEKRILQRSFLLDRYLRFHPDDGRCNIRLLKENYVLPW